MTQPPAPIGDAPPHRYTAALAGEIEPRWQERWLRDGAFRALNPGDPGFDPAAPRFYALDMFPYPSGAGLHVGHPEGYTATDIVSRYKRLRGFNVLHPMGWDAFGLPAEQYAIQTGVHPAITTRRSVDNFRRQLQRFGFSYDWDREFGTIDEEYYRWTQWIFLRLYGSWFDPASRTARPISELERELETGARPAPGPTPWRSMSDDARREHLDRHRLAYQARTTVNWCPKLGTVLANDEVIDGKSERGGHPVLRKPLSQWMFRITAYADRLLTQLDALDWPASTKAMQAEWIGRSTGAEIEFELAPALATRSVLRIFTTRPDTLFGATYMVVAPEHELCERVLSGEQAGVDDSTRAALRAYVDAARHRSDIERQESKEKTGIFTGIHAINPGTGERIPVWAADYVLMGYGTGAIMAVPAHDERDFEFARAFGLPIRDVVYSSAVLAMRHFAEHAAPDEQRDDRWADTLADFLGVSVSTGATRAELGTALARVRTGRARAAEPAAERRGSIRGEWLDAIRELKIASFADLRERFAGACFHDRAGSAAPEPGVAVHSANAEVSLDGLHRAEATASIIAWLERRGLGRAKTNYKLRDWTFSRQRYWGEPFPIVFDDAGRAYPVSESKLPVRLPELADYAPVESDDPRPLLAKATAWLHTTAGEAGVDPALLPPETKVTREANTMPGSAGSSWYAIRYCDARHGDRFVGRDAERYWMGAPGSPTLRVGSSVRAPESNGNQDGDPTRSVGVPGGAIGGVDLYLGGSEHAVGHLLYARFWQNVLYDLGEVSTPEPFRRLVHQGLITSFAYQRADKSIVPTDEVREVPDPAHADRPTYVEIATGAPVTPIVTKMSKRYKNVVNPDDVIAEYGADTCRLYEMYMGPLEASKPWNPRDITGCFRFLQRAWRLAIDEQTGRPRLAPAADPQAEKRLHRVVAKVEADIDRLAFNTAIAAMIEFVNAAGAGPLHEDQLARFMIILSPFAPHLAEEVWHRLGRPGSVARAGWPAVDPKLLVDDQVELAVQVQGKVRGKVSAPTNADPAAVEAIVRADPRLGEWLGGKSIKKLIVVPGRLVNIVAG